MADTVRQGVVMCSGVSGKRREPCADVAIFVDHHGGAWCGSHADRLGCVQAPRELVGAVVAARLASRPAGGTATDAQLASLPAWGQPHARHRGAWAARVRELLAVSPGRSLASAAIEAREGLR